MRYRVCANQSLRRASPLLATVAIHRRKWLSQWRRSVESGKKVSKVSTGMHAIELWPIEVFHNWLRGHLAVVMDPLDLLQELWPMHPLPAEHFADFCCIELHLALTRTKGERILTKDPGLQVPPFTFYQPQMYDNQKYKTVVVNDGTNYKTQRDHLPGMSHSILLHERLNEEKNWWKSKHSHHITLGFFLIWEIE